MAKAKTAYVCGDCGAEHTKWQGQCADCGAWNTLSAITLAPASAPAARSGYAGQASNAVLTRLADVQQVNEIRSQIGIGELDRVLGGGLVHGSVVLIGGDPGIGKSTLILQALAALDGRVRGLYVTGEESLAQVASRAQRLGVALGAIDALAETSVERILELAAANKPAV